MTVKTRLLCLCLALSLMLTTVLPVAADTARKELTVSLIVGEEVTLERNSNDPTFWEWPTMEAGYTRTGGKLTLRNTSTYDVQYRLTGVTLPYEDTEVLEFLNAVTLILRMGDTVLFHDRMVQLDTFTYDFGVLGSEESRELSVELHCDFAYTGKIKSVKTPIQWHFHAEAVTKPNVVPDTRRPLLEAGLAGAALVVVAACVLLKYGPRKKNKKSAKNS